MPDQRHEGLPVSGYRPQSGAAVELVNRSKALEERVLRFLDELAAAQGIDPRWFAIGRTQIEGGFMAVNRSVFKPGRADLPQEHDPRDAFLSGYAAGMDHEPDDAFTGAAADAWREYLGEDGQ